MTLHPPTPEDALPIACTLLEHPSLADGDHAASLAYVHLFRLGELAAEGPHAPEKILELGKPLLQGRLRNHRVDPYAWQLNCNIAIGTALSILSNAERVAAGSGKDSFTWVSR